VICKPGASGPGENPDGVLANVNGVPRHSSPPSPQVGQAKIILRAPRPRSKLLIMATPRPRQRLSWVPFLVYLVSFLLVISFILFEVLDIDGSDFPANPDAAGHSIRLSETEAVHDLRRLLPGGNPGGEAAATPFVVLSGGEPDPWGTPHSVHQALPDRIERRFRPVLPRASLGDPPTC
jgi:hypothetical protein